MTFEEQFPAIALATRLRAARTKSKLPTFDQWCEAVYCLSFKDQYARHPHSISETMLKLTDFLIEYTQDCLALVEAESTK